MLHFFNLQAWSCKIGHYTDGRTYDTSPAAIIEATGYTPVHISNIATFDFTQIDVLMVNVTSNTGPSADLLNRLTFFEIWIRDGGKVIFHDRSAGNTDSSLLINASSASLVRNTNTLIKLSPYGTGNNALILGEDGVVSEDDITEGMLQNTNGFALASTLPSETIKYLVSEDDTNNIAAFIYPLGLGYVYYSGIPLDYYFRLTDNTQPGKNYRTIYTPNLLKMVCKLAIETEPEAQTGDTCATAQDLNKLTSPYAASTTGYLPDFYNYCGNYAPDRIFYIDVPEGYQIEIQQVSNTYDSQHAMRYGGSCPGEHKIVCVNDSDTRVEKWLNLTGYPERVYWINGAYYRNGHGDFLLRWELTKPDINAIWKGNISNDWDDPGNWDIGHVPNEIVGVVIQSGALHYPQVNGKFAVNIENDDIPYRCRQLTIEQGGMLTTNDLVINYGTIQINGGNWNHLDNHDDSIVLENNSLLEINDGNVSCGNSQFHDQTDLIVKAGGKLLINAGTLEITDRLVIANGASFTAMSGHVAVGTYTGTITDNSHLIFEVGGRQSNLYVDQATIEIKRSGDTTKPGLWFHEDANISLNNSTFVFSNASDYIQNVYAMLNGHIIPNVRVQMSDNTHELIFCNAQNTIGQLMITSGTFRLNGTRLCINGNSNPAIDVGNDDGVLLVDSGTIAITQNMASLTAIQVQSGGKVEIQTNGIIDRRVSIADTYAKVIYVKDGGLFLVNGGIVYLNNNHAEYAWGVTVDSGGLFSMMGGTFHNDAVMHCYGELRFQGGTFNVAARTDETQSAFNIYEGASIYAQHTIFDSFSQASGQAGIHVYNNVAIGETIGDDSHDFDNCTFQNWHPQGQALTVDNTESFTLTAPIFNNTNGNNIVKESNGIISVTAYDGNRGGESYDAEAEGCTINHVNWDNTVSFTGLSNTGIAINPANGQTQYYAENTQIEISGTSEKGDSILWIVAPSGATIPDYGESNSRQVTLLKNSTITWYAGTAGKWMGLKSSQWDDPSNWADHKIPTKMTPVSIDSGCSYYPVLDKSLSINSDKGIFNCRSISLSSDATITTNANVYCYSTIDMQQGTWHHVNNSLASFEINAGGTLIIDNAALISPGLSIVNDGQLEINNSTLDFSYGIHNAHGAIKISNSTLSFGNADDLDDITFQVADQTMLEVSNSHLIFQGDSGADKPCIQLHASSSIAFSNSDLIFQLRENQDTMHADFATKPVDDVYIRMSKDTQTVKLTNHSARMNHLFVEKGIFDINGMTLFLEGDGTAMTIGNNSDSNAQVQMASGKISVNENPTDIIVHIIQNGHFLISGGTFERNLGKAQTHNKLIWIEAGLFEQTGGTVFIDNQYIDYHWDTLIESKGIFRLSGGTFQNDGRITCNGLIDLDGGTIQTLSNAYLDNASIHVLENGKIQAQNTLFQGTGVHVYENALIGTNTGDDDDDFDFCTFQDWSGSALTFSNSESFTITRPSFLNTQTNITKHTTGRIDIKGTETGTHGGEAFDSDLEGSPFNVINWENTRTLIAESATALAISPASNQTVYYASENTAIATGEILTGSVINWVIEPRMSTSPGEGEGVSAEFIIKENAIITWYSGVPGHWTGRTSSEWSDPENWSDHRVPNVRFDVLIPANCVHYPVLNNPLYINKDSGTIKCRSLTIEDGATFTVHSTVMAYSNIVINGNWIQETNSDTAIQLFEDSQLKLNNASFAIHHTSNDILTDILIGNMATFQIQNSTLTTQGRMINNGTINMTQANWQIQNDFDNAIDLQNGSIMEMSGGYLYCGDSAVHSQTDIHVGQGANLILNDGTIAIVDALKNAGHFIAHNGLIQVGTYAGSASGNSDTRFDIQENASFTLNNATIEIKGSTDKSKPGLYFHEQASVEINGGQILFNNARQNDHSLYAIPNNHDLPLVSVNLIDRDHEVVFADSDHTMKQLIIKQGTFRLDNDIINFTGTSPAVKIGDNSGDDDAMLLLENGKLQVNQNISTLQALLIQSDGTIDIQPDGIFERQLSIEDAQSYVIYIKDGGAFYLNGGNVTINNHQSRDAWGMTIDFGGLFQMNSGSFNNDASVDCYGTMRFLGGTFNLVSQDDEQAASFQINSGARIEARDTIFDHYSQASGESGIYVSRNAYIGDSSGDDNLDFDGCIFKNWHLQGVALTVDNSESFTIANPMFENASGKNITTTTAYIEVTGSSLGGRGGEAFDAEIEGSPHNQINWPDTISLYGKESTAQALHPDNGTYSYYAANTQINISGQAVNGSSLLWEITPSGSSIPESGENSVAQITLLKSSVITWYSGNSGLWTGKTSSSWTDQANWHDHKIPDNHIDVIIPNNCPHYPVLEASFSINGENGSNRCKSLALQSGATITTNSDVYCYSLVTMTGASWYHTKNQMDAFQVGPKGQLFTDGSELIIGYGSPLSGFIIQSEGKLLAKNNSTVKISHGIHIQSNASVEISNTDLFIGLGESLTDPVWDIEENAQVQFENSTVKIKGGMNINGASLQFHTNANIVFHNTPLYVALGDLHNDIYADFGGHTVNDLHIQMTNKSQSLKLVSNDVQMDHLLIENGGFDPNGNTIQISGNDTAIVIGDDHSDMEARLEMSAGNIHITGQSSGICAMHIYGNGLFSMSDGIFSRNISFSDSFDKVLWIEGIFQQSGGNVIINNQHANEHWRILITKNGSFHMSGGVFENDSRIACYGLMDFDDCHMKISSSQNETESGFDIFANATIEARNTTFSRYSHSSSSAGIHIHRYAGVGSSSGDDDDDFDLCQFEDWYIKGYALSFSNSESFTITHPVFTNSGGYNINANTNIYVTGTALGNRGGEQYDCDPEGSSVNSIHWENTRKLIGKDVTASAISPSMNQTYYYGKNTTAIATGQLLTGTAIHWEIMPSDAATPSFGDGESASFTINESAEIFWYSGVPGHWTGNVSSEWTNPDNWSDHKVPDHTIDVIIHGNVSHYPILDKPLYVNSSEGLCQCHSLKLQNGAIFTSTSRVIAYGDIEINASTWLQETIENEAIALNHGGNMNIIDASMTVGQIHSDRQTCVIINGGVFSFETGFISIADSLHVNKDGIFQMSGGKMILGTESNALSKTSLQPGTTGLFQMDSGAQMNISGGTIEIQASIDQTKALSLDLAAQVNTVAGEWIFCSFGSGDLRMAADFGGHEVYQVRVSMGQANHRFMLSDHDAVFNQLKIHKGQFELNSQTLSFNGTGPSIIIGDQSGTDDATLLLASGESILVNQPFTAVKALLIQNDGQFLMSGGQLHRDVFVEDDFDAVIHVTAGGLYEQTGGDILINNQSAEHYWGIWIDNQANFYLHGGTFSNDARTWCFGNMNIMDATYVIAHSKNEAHASFSVENTGSILAKNAVFSNIYTEQGLMIKTGAKIGKSTGDDDFDFDQCLFEKWHDVGSALTVENSESFTMNEVVFDNNGGMNINKQTAGQICVTGQSTGSRGGEQYDSDTEGGLTNYIQWDNTVSLSGQSISAEAIRPANQQTLYFVSGTEIAATGKGAPLSWEISPSESVSITAGESTPAEFVLNGDAIISWYSIKPGMWRGLISSDWHEPMNWDDGNVPAETMDVTIPYTFTNAPVINEPAVCANLSLKERSVLTLQSSLTINGHLYIENEAQLNSGNAILEIHGDWLNDGIFNAQTGTVVFAGYSNCQIIQNAEGPLNFNKMVIDKQISAVLSFGVVRIQNELILKTGIPHFTSPLKYATSARLTYAGTHDQTTGTELSSIPLPSVIHIDSLADVYLSKNLTISETLLFTKGYLVLGDYDLHLEENAVVDGAFSHSTSIVTNGSGKLIADISQPETLFFPVGSMSENAGFAPFTIIFHEGSFNEGQVRMQAVNDKPVENTSISNYTDQYWEVSSSGITNYSCTVMADLDQSSVQGESLYFGQWDGQNWYILDAVKDDSPKLSGKVTSFGLFTGGEYNTFASRIIMSGFMDHFCGVKSGGVSSEKNYAISGYNLIADIIITPPEQFEISTQSSTGFITYPQQLHLSPVNAQIPETQIYVRFRPTGTESVQKDILHTSVNALPKKVPASGSGLFIRTITLSAPTPSDNMQVKLTFDPEIFEYEHVLDGGADIRFRKDQENLPYWIQKWNPDGESIIWVRILDADVSSFDMEYGKDIMPPVSNGDETFALFDDFSGNELNLEKWQTKNISATLSDGSLIIRSHNESGGLSSIQSFESTKTYAYAAVYKATVNDNNYFTLFGFSEGIDPWINRTGIYGYMPSNRFGKQSGAISTSHETNKSIALYDENIVHLISVALNQGFGFDDNYIEFDSDPVSTAHAAVATYELGGYATIDWMYVYKNATPQITATIGAECNMPGGGIWLGNINSDWSNPKNWNTGGVPKGSDNVIIGPGCPNMPRLTATANCKNFEIKRNASLNLSNYQLNVYGEWKNSGTLIPQNGAVCFKGSIDVDASGLGPETQIVGNANHTQRYDYYGFYYLGYKFKINEDVTVVSFRRYFGKNISLWTDKGNLLATVTFKTTGGQWSEAELSEPLTLTGNESYVLAAYTGGEPYYLSTEIESGFPDGNIQESRYSSGADFPDTLSSVQWWMVDLVYKTGSGTGFENFHQLIVQKTGDHYVELRNVHIENRLTMKSGLLLINNLLTYGPDAALEYAIDTNYTTAKEFPVVDGPNNLIINGPGTVNLSSDRQINGRLTLVDGKLQLGQQNLSLGPDASVRISGQNSFLVTNDTGKVRQYIDDARTYVFPLGYTNMTPLTVDIESAQIDTQAHIDVSLQQAPYALSKPPNALTPLTQHWKIEKSGISELSCDIHAVYTDDNIPQTSNEKYFMGAYKNNDQWMELDRVDLKSNSFEGHTTDPQIVTAFEYDLANHLPSGVSKTISIMENESYLFTETDFGFSDDDPYDTFKALKIIHLPARGRLIFQSQDVDSLQIFDVSELNQLIFKPSYFDSDMNYAAIGFQVQDSDAGWSASSYTITVDVIRINKAPELNLIGPIQRRVSEDLFPDSWIAPYISANDPDGDTMTWMLVQSPVHGSAYVSGEGAEPSFLQYTPNANFFGNDQFVIGVQDTAIEPLSDTIVIDVIIDSVNDAPIFSCIPAQLTRNEDFIEAIDITVVKGHVPDNELSEDVDYYIIPETNGIFDAAINEQTGRLTLNAIDNKNGTVLLDIVANDYQQENSVARQTVSIKIVAVNDPPLFDLDQTEISVNEDFTQTYVVNVNPYPIPQDEISQSIHYYLSPSQIEFVNLSLNADTGQLTVTGIPDANGMAEVEIWADDHMPENNLAHQSLLIHVLPVNDPPTFHLDNTNVRLEQDFQDTIIINPHFEHIPSDEQTESPIFTISPSSVSFANVNINPNTGKITISSISNETGKATFVVTANDNQLHNYTSTVSFDLNVMEKMPPLSIQVSRKIVSLNEDFPQTEIIETVLETDLLHPDRSASFSISPTQIDFANIAIHSDTGTITITHIPDQSGVQEFTVHAVDNADPEITASDTFILEINSINDPPDFQLSENVIHCQENQVQPIIINIMPVPPPQDEIAQSVSYSITPMTSDLLDIKLNEFQKNIEIRPRHNQNGIISMTIIAREDASEFAESTQQISVTVLDVNSPPIFEVSSQSINIHEDFGIITLTVDPMVQPIDEQAQMVSYSIAPDALAFIQVHIDEQTGQLTVESIKDQFGEATLTLTAHESLVDENADYSQEIDITVYAVNDPPTFHVNQSVVALVEDYTATQMVTITPDPPPSNEKDQIVTYRLSPDTVDFANISIDKNTGTISINSLKDKNGSAKISIIADDHSESNNQASSSFNLIVSPQNDPPHFTLTQTSVILYEDFSGTTMIHATPNEVPSDEINQIVSYSINPVSVHFANISIDPVSGDIQISGQTNQHGYQRFSVIANDMQTEHNRAFQYLDLTVTSVNDPPLFSLSETEIIIPEDRPMSTIVDIIPEQMSADESGPVSYYLTPKSVDFVDIIVDSHAKTIQVQTIPDKIGYQMFTITADDHHSINNTAKSTFIVSVEPLNDPPIFSLTQPSVNLLEDFQTSYTVNVIVAEIPADEQNQFVSYAIDPEISDMVNLSLNTTSGQLTITSLPNANGSESITIIANDHQEISNTFTQTLVINVMPVNDIPIFQLEKNEMILQEDFSGIHTLFLEMRNVPQDEISQTVEFQLSPSTCDLADIWINHEARLISIQSIKNQNGNQNFVIIADDGQNQNAHYSQPFNLIIQPVNDPPAFSLSEKALTVVEDFEGDQTIQVIPMEIPADETDDMIRYTLSPSETPFAFVHINEMTGHITFRSNHNEYGSQLFKVIANDYKDENTLYEQKLSLTVLPVNDPPLFTLSRYSISVEEDFSSKESILVIPGLIPSNETGQTITYSLNPSSVSFAWVSINKQTGLIEIQSMQNGNGSQMVSVIADDGQEENNTTEISFSLTVSPINDPPKFQLSRQTLNLSEDFTETQMIQSTLLPVPIDEKAQIIQFSYNSESPNLVDIVFNRNDGSISISPIANANGNQIITVIADDGQRYQAQHEEFLTINIEAVNDSPNFSLNRTEISVPQNFTQTQWIEIIPDSVPLDEKDQQIAYGLSPETSAIVKASIDQLTGKIGLDAIPNQSGTQVYTVTANDGLAAVSASFTVTVKHVSAIYVNFITTDAREGYAPFDISFVSQVQGNVSRYEWQFGDGATSSDANPIHEYQTPGKFTVRLTAFGADGSKTIEKLNYIWSKSRQIKGQVIAKDTETGLSGYTVEVWQDGNHLKSTITDAAGKYLLDGLPKASHLIISTWPPYGETQYFYQYYNQKDSSALADKLSTMDNDLIDITFILERAPEIGMQGCVYAVAGNTDSGIPGVQVDIFSEKTMFGMTAMTDESGCYSLIHVKNSDDYRISVWSEKLLKDYYFVVPDASQIGQVHPLYSVSRWQKASLVQPSDPPLQKIDIILDKTANERGSIAGTVYKSDHTRLAGIWVTARSDIQNDQNSALSDTSGRYTITELTPVSEANNGYIVEIETPNYPYQAYHQADLDESPLLVETGRTDIDFYLRMNRKISGKITTQCDIDIRTRVVAFQNTHSYEVYSDINGNYAIDGLLPSSEYMVAAFPDNAPVVYFPDKNRSDDALLLNLLNKNKMDIDLTVLPPAKLIKVIEGLQVVAGIQEDKCYPLDMDGDGMIGLRDVIYMLGWISMNK